MTVAPSSSKLPEDPFLRAIAEEMEAMGRVAEMVDENWRFVYMSSELCRVTGVDPAQAHTYYGLSWITRDRHYPDIWGVERESSLLFWNVFAPYMRSTLEPGTPEFEEVFGEIASIAAGVEPKPMPALWSTRTRFNERPGLAYTPVQHLLAIRLTDHNGRFRGVLQISWPGLPGSVTGLLSRGDVAMYERMSRLAEPARRPAAILFIDLANSSALARRLSTHRFFTLIREFTTLVDAAIAEHGGIVGKHAGDGASGLFLAQDSASESATARCVIEAARAIRIGTAALGEDGDAQAKVGVHWGATVMIGQVVTGGRLEVTALGNEMNEAARVESTAEAGAILVTRDVIERLEASDAALLGIDIEAIAYRDLGAAPGASEKAIRDAGLLSVVEL